MKVSTKGRYGVRAMLELSLKYGKGPVMVREIAECQEISERYLELILNNLRTSGFVISTRGAKGGYELSKPPSDITVGDVIRALEGPFDVVSCTSEYGCEKMENCVTFHVWKEVKEAIEKVLDSITMEELVKRKYKLNNEGLYANKI